VSEHLETKVFVQYCAHKKNIGVYNEIELNSAVNFTVSETVADASLQLSMSGFVFKVISEACSLCNELQWNIHLSARKSRLIIMYDVRA